MNEYKLQISSPLIVGILNVTPDSFSDGGLFFDVDHGIQQAELMIKEGADIIEVGGEATSPNSKPVSVQEEISRIEPVLKCISGRVAVSVDTYKAAVAEKAISLGCNIINDVSACRADKGMIGVVRDSSAYVILMHSKERGLSPHVSDLDKEYADPAKEIAQFLLTRAEILINSGVSADKIILDPGMGRFLSKDPNVSWKLLNDFSIFCDLVKPYPVMVAVSRKGFLKKEGADLDLVSQTIALDAVRKGARLIRTHNPKMMREMLKR